MGWCRGMRDTGDGVVLGALGMAKAPGGGTRLVGTGDGVVLGPT